MSFLDPDLMGLASTPPDQMLSPLGNSSVADMQVRRFRQYSDMGFDVPEAQGLASRGDLDPIQVRRVNEHDRMVRMARELQELGGDDAIERWQSLSAEDKELLREADINLDPPKRAGLFAVPVIGTMAKRALDVGSTVAGGINDLTAGNLGKGLGAAIEGATWLQNKVNTQYRRIEYTVRKDGWANVWRPHPGDFSDGENSFRPGAVDKVREMADGNDAMVSLVRNITRGWTDEQILVHQGFEPGTQEYGMQLASLGRLRERDDVREMHTYLERQKMSPGRAWANLIGTGSDRDYTLTSGLIDGVWTMFADPTILVGKGVKVARYSRMARFNSGAQFAEHVDEVLGGVDKLVDARRIRTAGGEIINPLDHTSYFRGIRDLRKAGYNAQQVDAVVFMDHMLAGTRAGATAMGDDGVSRVLGQYVKMKPKYAGMVADMKRLIDEGQVTDELSMAAAMRDGVLLNAMRDGVGRPLTLDRAPGLFVPRLTRAGAVRMRAKMAINDPLDWSRQQNFAIKAGYQLRGDDLANAEVFLNETMRANRLEGQSSLDDYVDFAKAMRKQGFDGDTISEVVQYRMTTELGGMVQDGETPVYALARLAVREGRVDADGVRQIHAALRSLFPENAEKADALVAAFDDASLRYFNAFVDGQPPSYAETLLDDANLDDNLRKLLLDVDETYTRHVDEATAKYERDLERIGDPSKVPAPSILDRRAFIDRLAEGGLFTPRTAGKGTDDLDLLTNDFAARWRSKTFTMVTPQGQTAAISNVPEYLDLLAELGAKALDSSLDDLDEGARAMNAKLGMLTRLTKAVVSVPASMARQMPKYGYVEFGTADGIRELKRWLDLGVYGDDAEQMLGDFINAATDAQRRHALFTAQREMLRRTGILYDPAHRDWVRQVLQATDQAYGGAMIDSAGQLRPMALFPQAQSASALRLNDARDLMAHFQRTRFMQAMSPRFGSFMAKNDATYVQRVNRYWKPLAVLSPRLILRAGLDELLTLVGAEGSMKVSARYAREWALRAQQQRFTDAMRLKDLTAGDLLASGYERIPGAYDDTVDDVYRMVDDITDETVVWGDEQTKRIAEFQKLEAISQSMIDRGLLTDQRRLWELPPDELDQALRHASVENFFTTRRPILAKDAPHIIESARLTERIADWFIERAAARGSVTEGHMRAAMAMAIDPVTRDAVVSEVTHVGAHQSLRKDLDPTTATYGDVEELGFLGVVKDGTDNGQFLASDTTDLLGRKGLVEQLGQAQADDFIRDVVIPVRMMELDDDARLVLAEAVTNQLDMVGLPEQVVAGDPYRDEVVDGIFAPAVERAVATGDRVLQARLTWLVLPDQVKARVWAELDRTVGYQANADLRALQPEEMHAMYREHLGALGIGDESTLALDEDGFGRFVEWLTGARTPAERDLRWQIAVNDTPVRPGAPVDALQTMRVDGRGILWAKAGDLGDTRAMLARPASPHQIGPGVLVKPGKGGRPLIDEDPWGEFAKGTVNRAGTYVVPLRTATALPSAVAKDLVAANVDLLDALDGIGLNPAALAEAKAAFGLDPSDMDTVRAFVWDLQDRVNLLDQAHPDIDVAGRLYDLVDEHFYAPLRRKGIVGFADSADYATSQIIDLGELLGQGAPADAAITIFDQSALRFDDTTRITERGLLEAGLSDRYGDTVDQWLDLLQGTPSEHVRLAADRQVEYLTRTDYWEHFRRHDAVGPGNDVLAVPRQSDVTLYVPRRRGDVPGAPGGPRVADRQAAMVGYGSVDPDLAADWLALAARMAGDEAEVWELVEVVVPRAQLAGSRFDAGALAEMSPAGALTATMGPDLARFNDQLFGVDQNLIDRTPMRPDMGEPRLVLADAQQRASAWMQRYLADDFNGLDDLIDPDDVAGSVARIARNRDTMRPLVREHPELAINLILHEVLERVDAADALTPAIVGDRTGRLMRVHGAKFAAEHGLPKTWIDQLANHQARTGYRPDFLRFDALSPLSAQVVSGKRLDVATRGFVEELTRNTRGMFHDSHKGQPMWDLLGPVSRGTFSPKLVDEYHGALPAKVLRPKFKPLTEDRGKIQRFTDKSFEWIGKGIAELARYPMFVDTLAGALDDAKASRLVTPLHAARTADYADIFGDRFDELMLRFENEFAEVVGASDRAVYLTELDDDLILTYSRFYGDLPENKLEDFKAFLGSEMEYREIERRSAMVRTLAEVTPYIDDHRVRSQFADAVDEVIPFFYATEHFVRRWARTAVHSPEAFRRLQLYFHGFEASGIIETDANGDKVFEYPMTGFLMETVGNIFGAPIPGVNMQGKAIQVIPGLDEPFRFGVGPAFTAPLSLLRPLAPREIAAFEDFVGGERAVGRDLWEVFAPSTVTRFRDVISGNDTNEIAAMAYFEANFPEMVPGNQVDELGNPRPPTENEVEAYRDSIRHGSRIVGFLKGVVGAFVPASPRIDFDAAELNPEFVALLDAGLPMEIAVGEFLKKNPHATAYTVFASETSSGAPTDPTRAVFDALDANREFYDAYDKAGPWLLPYDVAGGDQFHAAAWSEMVAMGMRSRKTPESWWEDMKFAQGAALYFPSQDAKEAALANASPTQRDQVKQAWRMWKAEFDARHPVFATKLASREGITNREQVRTEMRLALDDEARPEVPQADALRELLDGWDRVSLIRMDHVSYSLDERRAVQLAFHDWARKRTAGDHMAQTFYLRNMMKDLELPVDVELAATAEREVA